MLENHEFYKGDWYSTIEYLRDECAEFYNIHFLESDTVKIGDVTFIGGTLWTNMNNKNPLVMEIARSEMNDYRLIRNEERFYKPITPIDTILRHEETFQYFDWVLKDITGKVVVVSHHAPSTLSNMSYNNDDLTWAYCSDLSNFILDHKNIKLWIHGHTHQFVDYILGDTRVTCNPRGYQNYTYYDEKTGFIPNLIVEV